MGEKIRKISIRFVKLRTEAYTSTLGLLTHLSVRIMLLKTWQRLKNHPLAKLLQGFRQQVTIMSQNIFAYSFVSEHSKPFLILIKNCIF